MTADHFAGILDEVVGAHDVVITFDDGNESDATIALPLLRERGLVATFFVIASRIATAGSLSSIQIRELVDARAMIEAASGRPVTEAACPFGAYDRKTLGLLREMAYHHVYTVDGGYADSTSWLQTRRSIHADDDAGTVRDLVRGPRRGVLANPVRAAKQLAKRWR